MRATGPTTRPTARASTRTLMAPNTPAIGSEFIRDFQEGRQTRRTRSRSLARWSKVRAKFLIIDMREITYREKRKALESFSGLMEAITPDSS